MIKNFFTLNSWIFKYCDDFYRNVSDSSSSTTIPSTSSPPKQTEFAVVEAVENDCEHLVNEIPAFNTSSTDDSSDLATSDLVTVVVRLNFFA